MATEVYVAVALLAIAIVFVTRRVWGALTFRGKMLITCPETHEPAAVKVNLRRATLNALAGRDGIELCDCSRWPERADCDQDCVPQIERDPENHRVWSIASHWFTGKKCVYCGKRIDTLSHFDHKPALLDRESKTEEWNDLPAENLPGAFSEDLPVCWSCHMTQKFVREHPDMVVVRPWEKSGPLGEYVPKKANPKDSARA